MKIILATNYDKLTFVKRGKVRDLYDTGEHYLIVSTDRLSAFDVIMNQGIPYKGMVLTKISNFWFDFTRNIVKNHIVSTRIEDLSEVCKPYTEELNNRFMLVKKTRVISLECIVRGYISGSGLKDYKSSGEICGRKLPVGLVESEQLPEPIFTPSTKAEIGEHDENISIDKAIDMYGKDIVDKLEFYSLSIFKKCSEYALNKGIIIADTKMEFGIDETGEIVLIDELLTPDSSRFWPLYSYEKGKPQNSFDKQYVRDYLESISFNKQPPAPDLPDEVIRNTSLRYIEALKKITGEEINFETN